MESLGSAVALIIRLAPVFAVYYAFLYFRQKKKKPGNVYHLKPQDFEIWYQKNQKIQLMLALGYLLVGIAVFLPGYLFVVPVLFLLVVYILRIRNNLSRVREDHEIPGL